MSIRRKFAIIFSLNLKILIEFLPLEQGGQSDWVYLYYVKKFDTLIFNLAADFIFVSGVTPLPACLRHKSSFLYCIVLSAANEKA